MQKKKDAKKRIFRFVKQFDENLKYCKHTNKKKDEIEKKRKKVKINNNKKSK